MRDFVALADKARETCANRIGELADKRLKVMRKEWKRTYPHRKLHIVYGNGTEFIQYTNTRSGKLYQYDPNLNRLIERSPDDEWVMVWHRDDVSIPLLYDAQDDVDKITDGYRDGCPNGVTT